MNARMVLWAVAWTIALWDEPVWRLMVASALSYLAVFWDDIFAEDTP